MSTGEERRRTIEYALIKALSPNSLTVEDDSVAHAGHAGAASGGGHFTVRITASIFDGKTLIERHRLVYDALGELMKSEIHALRIDAKAPKEVELPKKD